MALWHRIDRRNVMIGIPATPRGLAAIEDLVASGTSVDATRIFSRGAHARAAEAYRAALERRAAAGLPLREVAGVASFLLSGLDGAVDALLDEQASQASSEEPVTGRGGAHGRGRRATTTCGRPGRVPQVGHAGGRTGPPGRTP